MALNTSWSTSAGRGPAEIEKSWYWPGSTLPPVHVTSLTASVTGPSSLSSGGAIFSVLVVGVQPSSGLTDTDAIGWPTGICTRSWVVDASSRSLGTRKDSWVKLPLAASPGWMVTCAQAGCAHSTASAIAPIATTAFRAICRSWIEDVREGVVLRRREVPGDARLRAGA